MDNSDTSLPLANLRKCVGDEQIEELNQLYCLMTEFHSMKCKCSVLCCVPVSGCDDASIKYLLVNEIEQEEPHHLLQQLNAFHLTFRRHIGSIPETERRNAEKHFVAPDVRTCVASHTAG